MSESARVQRWRQRQREEGKEPMTLWLSQPAKYRLEEMARVWRSSPSEMLEQALAQFHPGSPTVPGTVADTEQLQALVTDTVHALLAQDLPTLVRAAIQDLQPILAPQQADVYQETPTAPAPATDSNVTDTLPSESLTLTTPAHASEPEPSQSIVTAPTPSRKGGRPRSAIGQQILALLAAHPEGLSAEQIRGSLSPGKRIGDTLSGMKRLGTVQTRGQGKAVRYFVAARQ